MKIRKPGIKLVAIAGGVGVFAIGAVAAYWQLQERQWCLRFTSNGGQEVTYSWGCHNPRRYKQWVVTASNSHLSSLHHQELMAPGRQIH